VNALLDGEPMKLLKSSSGCYCWIIENNFCQGVLNSLEFMKVWSRCAKQ